MPPLRPLTAPPRCLISGTRCLASLGGAASTTPHTTISQRRSQPRARTAAPTTQFTRPLSSTPHPQRQKPSYLTVPKDQVPEYPYGPFRTYKQANQGLFGGAKIRFGNTVAEEHGRRSRTSWLPNRHVKRLWSPALNDFIRTRLTSQVLRTIDGLGGIDEYLLGAKAARIKKLGPAGWALRWKIIQTPAIQARFAREREALGLPPKQHDEVVPPGKEDDRIIIAGTHGKKTTAREVNDVVDGMIARDEEFELGEEAPAKPAKRKGRKAAAKRSKGAAASGKIEGAKPQDINNS